MSQRESLRTEGFGVPDTVDPHHFVVRVPSGNSGDIEIIEHFGITADSPDDDVLLRCRLTRKAWNGIKDEAKRVLNERLREKNLKTSRWSAGDNKLERLLGREFCLLAWAVETARPDDYPAACAAWASLKPEERWWLFRMCDHATGTAADTDIGWRKAVRVALTETPGPLAPTKRRKTSKPKADADLFALLESKD
ncbi:MAG: DUF3780 domain-containing protein [Mesorhizobium sp.]|uniref:anti-phage-associated DUF3780 domain-containing protein n=1 Tax=Mesorhizobium sp. TaxID=1871066 RepID=UPI000FEAADF5|nr:anti-phage-associated DUF3780 domain-containing protein [Mesorhizobium sp.]RWL80663.1 MAG: DUF3780 domain-containing protein [Mesorhizobium sp.]